MSETLLFSPPTIRGIESRPVDAALKLSGDGRFRNVPPQFGYWLGTCAGRGFGTQPSTRQNGLDDIRRHCEFMGRVERRVRHRFILPVAGGSN